MLCQAWVVIVGLMIARNLVEESPDSIGATWLLAATWGDPRDSATENSRRPACKPDSVPGAS
jgi:hypothetical protein